MRGLSSKCILIMFYSYILILITCILLSQKIILINEESLIMFCFILTVNIIIQNFNVIKDSSINEYILQENLKLKLSFTSLIKSLKITKSLKTKNIIISIQFIKNYKNYWFLLCKNFLTWISLNLLYSVKTSYYNFFVTLKNKEQTFLNLFHTELCYKLSRKFILNKFLIITIFDSKSMSKNLINWRNWVLKRNYQVFEVNI